MQLRISAVADYFQDRAVFGVGLTADCRSRGSPITLIAAEHQYVVALISQEKGNVTFSAFAIGDVIEHDYVTRLG
ncbi:hypothetical protein AXW85_07495 [Pseudomonas aeruginosa]|nr:hypothetical protein AXW85_07495 [Pseudomonas aeruginosa]